jgi:hypothetical protein
MTPINSSARGRRRWVDVMSQTDIEYWAKELGCSHWQLLDAIAYVGLGVDELRRHLGSRQWSGSTRIEPVS